MIKKPIRVVSLFSGAGGGDLGLTQAGLDIVYACDNDEFCNETYLLNFGHPQWTYPVQYVTDVPACDVIVGGPPCQSFSNARSSGYAGGYRNLAGLENVYEMHRIVAMVKPKLFVCENVPTLLQNSMVNILNAFKSGFKIAGYEVDTYLLSTEDYGIPQQRERVFLFGVRNDLHYEGIRFRKPATAHWSKYWSGWAEYLDLPERGLLLRRASSLKGKQWNEAAYTILSTETLAIRFTNPGHRMTGSFLSAERSILGADQRYLTVEEMAKLQGFDSDFIFAGSSQDQIRQIGNAWSVNVGKAIGESINDTLNKGE